jgi:hypothetical protein
VPASASVAEPYGHPSASLSIFVAACSIYKVLDISSQLDKTRRSRKQAWLAGPSLVIKAGVRLAMQCNAERALVPPIQLRYDSDTDLLFIVPAIAVSPVVLQLLKTAHTQVFWPSAPSLAHLQWASRHPLSAGSDVPCRSNGIMHQTQRRYSNSSFALKRRRMSR